GGLTAAATARAARLLRRINDTVHELSSPDAAELAKLLENVFRNVNIALVNQLALLCERVGLDVWEGIEAAAAKPFGVMAFRPGRAAIGGPGRDARGQRRARRDHRSQGDRLGSGLFERKARCRYRQQLAWALRPGPPRASTGGRLEAGELTEPLRVRPATAADSALLLEWANDPETRAASFSQHLIEAREHARWLAATLASPNVRLLIGCEGERAVGQVRFVCDATGAAEISISVAPDTRGRGVGGRMLRAAIDAVKADEG